MKGGRGGRSWSSSMSNLFSWGTQPESPATSNPDEGSGGSSVSEDDNESDGEGKAGSDDGASDSGSDSDGESPRSSESGREEASDNKGTQQDGWTMKVRGLEVRWRGQVLEVTAAPPGLIMQRACLKHSHQQVNLNTFQTLLLPDLDYTSWTKTSVSGGTKRLVWASDNGMSMTCDHADPCKEAKSPNQLGPPLDYMMSCGVFNPKKTSKYDLCCFYQVGLSGDLPKFPSPHASATHEQVSSLLLNTEC